MDFHINILWRLYVSINPNLPITIIANILNIKSKLSATGKLNSVASKFVKPNIKI